ncbi:Gfo/Idh/MocA family oxidoreductase [Streptomyces piniterrae]|uniref:Gfo/Idh/MocA family oxidoreductase n=1 Tax=Streptomyces piniterrae TaxID=2571125 RepID=A0A4U0MXT8_9ACTN|nr:Gfo/Idh/MocA family oxidoreductase [Streptomyces piniterrae]TJZ45999.1 Gfo/Idh/MocA family oxidoreductase [Streptomyces piniterrae]
MADLGVIGLIRGLYVARWCARIGVRVTALCDSDPARLTEAAREFPDALRTARWQDLLAPEAGLDGVLLAHDFDRHAEPAVAFLDRGIHVLSETAACTTEREGRALVAAAERGSASYSFAENYVTHAHVRAIRRIVRDGGIGTPQLIESDYLHGASPEDIAAMIGDPAHWRGRIPSTAYCTHALSPVLDVTGAWPVEVSAFPVTAERRPAAVVLMVRLSDGGLAVTRQSFLQGEPDSHWHWFSVRGSRGLAESVRAAGDRCWHVRLRRDAWATADGRGAYEEELTPPALRLAAGGGAPGGPRTVEVPRHDEGTALIADAFRACMEEGAAPRVPVRPAVAASLVGTSAAVSLAEGGRAVAVPDVRSWPGHRETGHREIGPASEFPA